MMIRAYLDWSRTAGAADRAEAVGMLADVFLHGELAGVDRSDAEAALVLALEDPSPVVRLALAQALGGAERAPRAVISALARDQADIAATVVANSPVLSDTEVAELAIFASGSVLQAACTRPFVSENLAEALAIVADAEAAVLLLDNPGAEVSLPTLRTLADRHAEDAAFREALLARDDLPAELRFMLADAAARHLTSFVSGKGWMTDRGSERLRQEAVEAAAITVAREAEPAALAIQLLQSRHLTPQLLLRAMLSGEIGLFAAALAELGEVDHRRAMGFIQARGGVGFAALCRKAGLPTVMIPAFAAAVAAWQALAASGDEPGGRLSRVMIETVLSGVALIEGPEMGKVRALLLGFHAEAVRAEALLRIQDLLAAEPQATVLADGEPGEAAELNVDALDHILTDALEHEFRAAA
jgi:uncharacterized protein (DUF2336 family)